MDVKLGENIVLISVHPVGKVGHNIRI